LLHEFRFNYSWQYSCLKHQLFYLSFSFHKVSKCVIFSYTHREWKVIDTIKPYLPEIWHFKHRTHIHLHLNFKILVLKLTQKNLPLKFHVFDFQTNSIVVHDNGKVFVVETTHTHTHRAVWMLDVISKWRMMKPYGLQSVPWRR
jgi:hypothetical protein